MRATDALGRHGEDLAAQYLESSGLTILERNWRCDLGEIDIVALDGDVLVVCEVKTRRSDTHGTALDAVTPVKVARLRRLCARWLAGQPVSALRFRDTRLDVVAVARPRRGPAHIDHVQGVG